MRERRDADGRGREGMRMRGEMRGREGRLEGVGGDASRSRDEARCCSAIK